jgi:hypothetical protein
MQASRVGIAEVASQAPEDAKLLQNLLNCTSSNVKMVLIF